ncbi:MAG: Kelch repeat-containing protein [Ilumatobacteraceae bacterium]
MTPNATTTYTLTVSNGAGHSITQFLTVYVNRLSITVQPQDITTDNPYGQNLSVTASASGALSYQWYKDSSAISNANSSSYRATQDGAYHVVVTSTLNGVSRTATSSSASFYMNTVSISLQPVAALVAEGDINTFSVVASGSGTLSYQWKRNGTDVSGATTSSFTSGTYGNHQVVVTSTLNGHTTSVNSNSVLLDVNTVTITHSPSDAYMTQGGTASLGVTVSSHGSATISYQWYLDGNELPGENDIGVYAAQAGEYKVKVTSVRGGTTFSRFSDVATVTEVPPPTISSFSAASSSIAIGNSTQITAVFSGGTGIITPGSIPVSSGDTITVSPSTSTSYTLTVVNPAGTQAGHTIRITVTTGTFTATANNSNANRYMGTKSVTLQSGKVVVFGGFSFSKITDVYDPATNSFSRVGDLNRERHGAGAALLPNGKVLAIGGMYASGANYISLSTVEIFDPVTETWSYTGSLNVARENPVVVVLNNGKVLVTGGMWRAPGTTYLSSAEIYDPATGTFTYVNSMPQARGNATGALMSNGNVFVAGGYNSTNGHMKSAIIYNPTLNTWTSISSQMNSVHSEGGSVTLQLQDGRMLVAGGWSPTLGIWTIDIYDPSTNSFVAAANLPQFSHGRGGLTGHVRSDGVVVFFGGSSAQGDIADTAVLYDPTSNTMATEGNTMRWYRYQHTSAVLNDGRILIIGGNFSNNSAADVYAP